MIQGFKRQPLQSDVIHGERHNSYTRVYGRGYAISAKEYITDMALCEGDYLTELESSICFKIMSVKRVEQGLFRYTVSEIKVIDLPETIYATF